MLEKQVDTRVSELCSCVEELPDLSDLSSEFLAMVNSGRIRVYTSPLVYDLRITSLLEVGDGVVGVIIPQNFSTHWGGERLPRRLITMVYDSLGEARRLSGKDLVDFMNEKERLLLQMSGRISST